MDITDISRNKKIQVLDDYGLQVNDNDDIKATSNQREMTIKKEANYTKLNKTLIETKETDKSVLIQYGKVITVRLLGNFIFKTASKSDS